MCLCVRKNFIFTYFLSYYKPCTINSAKNRALLKNLPKQNTKPKETIHSQPKRLFSRAHK